MNRLCKTYGELFEDSQKKVELGQKIRDTAKKVDELTIKKNETAAKIRDEEDPLKSEILTLTAQKLEMQKQIAKIDVKITAVKLKQEQNK
jgi:hypothetical protein